MAEVYDPLLTLKEQITCCVCLEIYKQPKILDCQHIFCLKCIEEMPIDIQYGKNCQAKYKIQCPTCHETTQISKDSSATNLPPASSINTKIKLFRKSLPTEMSYQMCPQHSSDKDMFCEKCEQMVCAVCAIRKHNGHTVRKAMTTHQLRKLRQQLHSARDGLDALEEAVHEQVESSKSEVDRFVEKLVQIVQQSHMKLKETMDEEVRPKLALIDQQTKEVNNLYDQIRSCEESVTTILSHATQEKVLQKKTEMVESMKAVCQQVNVEEPPSKESLVFIPIREDFVMECNDIGKVVGVGLPAKKVVGGAEVARCNGRGSVIGMVGVQRIFTLELPSKPYQDILCFLYNNNKGACVRCTINTEAAGSNVYNVAYTPTHSGLHYIIVRDGDIDIPCHPSTISILPHPQDRECKLGEELVTPRGIAVAKYDVVVVSEEANSTIAIVSKGEVIARFGEKGSETGQLLYPAGVAFTPDCHIVVADTYNHRIQKFTVDGECVVGCVGSKGSGKLQFQFPYDVAIDSKGRVYVSDTDNRRIQVLLPDLSFSHMIGEGILCDPHGIAIDSQDVLYICDDNTVHKVSSDGKTYEKLVASFVKPYCIAIDTHDIIYVVDNKENVVLVFDCDGEKMCTYKPCQASPSGIAIDLKENILYTMPRAS